MKDKDIVNTGIVVSSYRILAKVDIPEFNFRVVSKAPNNSIPSRRLLSNAMIFKDKYRQL